jgi:hypothetical protein
MLLRTLISIWFYLLMMVGTPLQAADSMLIQQALANTLPDYATKALSSIPEPGRKLLAARTYYRSLSVLEQRWSWSEAQIAAYQGSPEQKMLLDDIALIAQQFSNSNPGYSLFTNTQVRSLDKQISSWNNNDSVGAAAASLMSALESDRKVTLSADNTKLAEQLKSWLSAYSPQPRPNLAAPGLSAHGQMHAIDFQISKNGVLIAQANSAEVDTIWRTQGWDVKLRESITATGLDFKGPLTSPDEPWHYSYTPNKELSNHVEISP